MIEVCAINKRVGERIRMSGWVFDFEAARPWPSQLQPLDCH